jgi:hypothetical protein
MTEILFESEDNAGQVSYEPGLYLQSLYIML